jgi:hypothetical protein
MAIDAPVIPNGRPNNPDTDPDHLPKPCAVFLRPKHLEVLATANRRKTSLPDRLFDLIDDRHQR